MSRKNRQNRATEVADVVNNIIAETPEVPSAAETIEVAADFQTIDEVEKINEANKPVDEPVGAAEPVTEAPKPMYYGLIATPEELAKRTFRRGFETVLINELSKGPGTAEQLANRMLASGEFQRVAPRAAELRPTKPTQYLLNRWVEAKILASTDAVEDIQTIEAATAAVEESAEVTSAAEQVAEATTV